MHLSPLTLIRRGAARAEAPSGWRARAALLASAAGLLALLCALLALVQLGTPGLADNDGYYHIKMALLLREQGLRVSFAWLPLSILSPASFYDHHMLYHAYLALFTGDGSAAALIRGAKIASVLMPALAFLAIWWLLRGQGVHWAALWTIGLCAISQAFLYRMSMPRAQAASLLLLALALHWLLRRRYAALLPLGFVYVWLYNAFPLLLALAAVALAATLLSERRLEWRALAYPAAGVGLGLILNPYFPQDLAFIVQHLAPKIGAPETSVGNEWYPYQTWTLVENSGAALALWLLGALGLGWRGQRIDRPTLTAFALSVLFGLLMFKSRRFVEYFPAFALIFAALSLAPQIAGWAAASARRRLLAPALLAAALLAPLALTLGAARDTMASSKPAATFAGASGWLQEHTPPGSRVFQTDWDDFPRLFFYNTSNTYTIGLDPTYMQLYDARLYDQWVAITRGEVERPGAAIRERFGAAFVVSDLEHRAFMRQAAADPRMREVYRDEFAVVYAVD